MLFSRPAGKKHGILLDSPVHDDGRCADCGGVCCRSFVSVELAWPEYERLRQLGAGRLELSLNGRQRLIIDNGCEFLTDGRCTIYADRPDICRRFFCEDHINDTS